MNRKTINRIFITVIIVVSFISSNIISYQEGYYNGYWNGYIEGGYYVIEKLEESIEKKMDNIGSRETQKVQYMLPMKG